MHSPMLALIVGLVGFLIIAYVVLRSLLPLSKLPFPMCRIGIHKYKEIGHKEREGRTATLYACSQCGKQIGWVGVKYPACLGYDLLEELKKEHPEVG
jgi:hypothetical protein